MKVRDVMTADPDVIRPDNTLEEAAERMRVLDVGPLPVCDGTRLVGMITDRDITVRSTAQGSDPTVTKVAEAMSTDVVYCYDDDDVQRAADMMRDKQIRRLVVLNRDQALVGIIALGDIAVDTGDENVSGKTLEEVSRPVSS